MCFGKGRLTAVGPVEANQHGSYSGKNEFLKVSNQGTSSALGQTEDSIQ